MVDIWLTLGTMVADERLLELVTNATTAKPNYKRFGTVIAFGDPKAKVPDPDAKTIINKQGGVYLEEPTVALRNALFDFFNEKYPDFKVPISLYCAGMLCSTIDTGLDTGIPFLEAIKEQTMAYKKFSPKPQLRREFLMALGLVLIDFNARVMVKDNAYEPLFARLYLDATQTQIDVLKAIVKPLLEVGGDHILSGPRWGEGCLQVHEYYDKFPYAIG